MSAHPQSTPFRILMCLVLGSIHLLPAQQIPTYTLTGRVLDDSTKLPLENANVFIANSTMGAPTNQQGLFRIRNVPAGTHELIASIVGYVFHTGFVRITDSTQPLLEIRLKQKVLQLGGVEVVGADPAEWRKDLARFKGAFLGEGSNADMCTLVNPEILSFSTDLSGTFEARAPEPLRIENNGLGYEVLLRLMTFSIGPRWLTYGWRSFYREIPAQDDDRRLDLQKARLKAYKGSLRHFLASLSSGRAEKEGFSIYVVTNPRLSNGRMRMPVSEDEILSPGSVPNEKVLRFQDYLEVEYNNGPGVAWRTPRGNIVSSNSQISWVQLSRDFVTINLMGEYIEPYSLNITGAWALQRVADALPSDYLPPKNN
jgi:hypothetical protein